MRIVMLGHSGVGKTSFMTSMYGRLQQPMEGISVKAAYESDHQTLSEAYAAINAGVYPPATSQRDLYQFNVRSKRFALWGKREREVYGFEWFDYRGGALNDRSSSEDHQDLMDDLAAADAIIAFFDATALGDSRQGRHIGRMVYVLNEVIVSSEKPRPVAVVCTKRDLVSKVDTTPLDPLLSKMRHSPFVLGCAVAVSAGPKQKDVEVPLLFVLWAAAALKAKVLEEALAFHQRKADFHQLERRRSDPRTRQLAGQRGHWKAAHEERERLAQLAPQLEAATGICNRMQPIRRRLSSLRMFGATLFEGTEVQS